MNEELKTSQTVERELIYKYFIKEYLLRKDVAGEEGE